MFILKITIQTRYFSNYFLLYFYLMKKLLYLAILILVYNCEKEEEPNCKCDLEIKEATNMGNGVINTYTLTNVPSDCSGNVLDRDSLKNHIEQNETSVYFYGSKCK